MILNVLLDFLGQPHRPKTIFDKFLQIEGSVTTTGQQTQGYVYIPGKREDRVLLVAHADTVLSLSDTKAPEIIIKNNNIITNKHGGVLGADDRAGCAILWLLKDSGHSILVLDGEESGMAGSRWLMSDKDMADIVNSHNFVVQLDKSGENEFKCYNVGSPEFIQYVQESTGYIPLPNTSYTDIVTLCRDICGVNFSVGYFNEHTDREELNIDFWLKTYFTIKFWLEKPQKKFVLERANSYSCLFGDFGDEFDCSSDQAFSRLEKYFHNLDLAQKEGAKNG